MNLEVKLKTVRHILPHVPQITNNTSSNLSGMKNIERHGRTNEISCDINDTLDNRYPYNVLPKHNLS